MEWLRVCAVSDGGASQATDAVQGISAVADDGIWWLGSDVLVDQGALYHVRYGCILPVAELTWRDADAGDVFCGGDDI